LPERPAAPLQAGPLPVGPRHGSYRLAINGFGRIGRSVLRALYESGRDRELLVVAINEPADLATMAHLTRYDSTHGRFPGHVSAGDGRLIVDGHAIAATHHAQHGAVDWAAAAVDVVLECSGSFASRAGAELHLRNGAGAVLFSQPAEQDVDATIVYGVNQGELQPWHRVVSAGSCTTNAAVPVIAALHRAFTIEYGLITTIHSAMNDQPVIDAYHHTDLRKTRSAMHSIIPVETGLARGIDRVLPELRGRFEAQAMRVPVTNVSAIDLTLSLADPVDVQALNRVLQEASRSGFGGVLGYTEEPLASCDFNHDSHSAVVDASQTRVAGAHLAKVLIWFDNEWGYANRMLDVAAHYLAVRAGSVAGGQRHQGSNPGG
jgi:D-erythrose 4-phosphate dehydrogenase